MDTVNHSILYSVNKGFLESVEWLRKILLLVPATLFLYSGSASIANVLGAINSGSDIHELPELSLIPLCVKL